MNADVQCSWHWGWCGRGHGRVGVGVSVVLGVGKVSEGSSCRWLCAWVLVSTCTHGCEHMCAHMTLNENSLMKRKQHYIGVQCRAFHSRLALVEPKKHVHFDHTGTAFL